MLLAGLKLIELFSICQLEEFYFYQWIFVFDYFGITIEMKNKVEEGETLAKLKQSPFEFIPYASL